MRLRACSVTTDKIISNDRVVLVLSQHSLLLPVGHNPKSIHKRERISTDFSGHWIIKVNIAVCAGNRQESGLDLFENFWSSLTIWEIFVFDSETQRAVFPVLFFQRYTLKEIAKPCKISKAKIYRARFSYFHVLLT